MCGIDSVSTIFPLLMIDCFGYYYAVVVVVAVVAAFLLEIFNRRDIK